MQHFIKKFAWIAIFCLLDCSNTNTAKHDEIDIFLESLARAEKGDKYGVINKQGKEVISKILLIVVVFPKTYTKGISKSYLSFRLGIGRVDE